jgi:threonine/homoserine/homoserine lactone efflux protein
MESVVFVKGIITGIILSIMLGPTFFLLLETSIRKGIKSALIFDAGVLVSDIFYITIAYLFYHEVQRLTIGANQEIIKLIGGIVLIIFGLVTIFQTKKNKSVEELESTVQNSRDYVMLFIKGLVVNMLNPVVIFYWFGVLTLASNKLDVTGVGMIAFIFTILITFFSIDILKIVGAEKVRPFITPAVLKQLNRIIGGVLVIFGIVMIFRGSL